MSYRTIRQVLGETSLERKCRVLFGVCLLFLIGGSFYFASRISEDLAESGIRSRGSDLIALRLVYLHGVLDEVEQSPAVRKQDYVEHLFADLVRNQNYEWKSLIPEGAPQLQYVDPDPIASAAEKRILDDLFAKWQKANSAASTEKIPSFSPPGLPRLSPQSDSIPLFADLHLPDARQYHYYEVVTYGSYCKLCHQPLNASGSVAASDPSSAASQPFSVMKVMIPDKETQAGINRARAVLIAVGLAAVFLSMVALYLVVRYVIVNPLKHLRMVSDAISKGNLDTRADIKTGDEFQALADSFNRMLRHLTDSQAGLEKLNAELDNKVDELAQLNIQLYQMNQLKGDFLANMSHELRTPLNSIIGFSEVLVGIDALNDKQRRYAQNIQKSGRILLEMINDILDLAKMEAGKMDVKLSEFAIDRIIEAQCDMVRALTEEKNIDLHVVIEPDLPLLFQDQGKVQQILTNLLSNAIKFTPEGGRIVVSAHDSRNRMLEVTVADTGVGIPMSEREVIFEKFRQGRAVVGDDNLTRKHSGTGLGLSIVRELCKLLGGEVSVESDVGKGSTFKVVLPWSRAEIVRGETAAAPVSDAGEAAWNHPLPNVTSHSS